MLTKIVVMAISAFALSRREKVVATVRHSATEWIKRDIRPSVFDMAFKLFIGVILVAVVIFALIQLGQALQILAEQYENGLVIELVAFAVVALGCMAALFIIFKRPSLIAERERHRVESAMDLHSVDFQRIISRFLDGIVHGAESKRRTPPPLPGPLPQHEGG